MFVIKTIILLALFLYCPFIHAQLPDSIEVNSLSSLRLGLRHDRFSKDFSNWSTGIFEYKFVSNSLQFIPRVTYSRRFDTTGLLAELDAYKTLPNSDYVNISGGISSSTIFPTYRATAHYFNPFGKWENSFGVTYTHFNNFGGLFTLIAGLSRYYSNWLSTLRIYFPIQPQEQINGLSLYNENRYYLSNNSYFSFSIKYGFDTNFISVIDNTDLVDSISSILYGTGLSYNSPIKNYFQWKLLMEWSRFDFQFFDRDQYSLTLFLTKYRK